MFSSLLRAFGKIPGRYVNERAFTDNRTKQTVMVPQTMAVLRKHGVTDETELKLEFFFYTNSETKASALADVLKRKGYTVQHGQAPRDKALQIVTGWTGRMKMIEAVVVAWTRGMCDIGYAGDCDFDGWGTQPKQ